MILITSRYALPLALSALLVSGCGGGGGATSVSSGGATNPRYGQTMTIIFNGTGMDQSLSVAVTGPCANLTKTSATATQLQYTCFVTGVGRLTPFVSDRSGVVLASVAVDVPLPQLKLTVTDGTRTGSFTVELDPIAAPLTTSQFISYANSGFYTYTSDSSGNVTKAGTAFHRVNPSIGVLAGGYSGNVTTGVYSAMLTTQGDLVLEVSGLKNLRGTVAMYHEPGKPNSANSMFFINTVDNPSFDRGSADVPEGFTVFGKVVDGMGTVVDEIAKVNVRPDISLGVGDVPVTPVRITAISQTR
jgi:peptidyl-prolyl cis-trans isomerase A (cyclophilin A)